MNKIVYLLHLSAVILYCRYLAEFTGKDIAIYLFSLAISLWWLRQHKLISKGFLLNFLFIQSLTMWGCHLFLDPTYQLVTERLRYFKGLLLGILLILELIAGIHIVQRYLVARRRKGMFASEAFSFAIEQYSVVPELQKIFIVEFNIWRALLVRIGLKTERDGSTLKVLSKINPGYRSRHVRIILGGLVAINFVCLWLMPGLWLVIPFLATLYITLVLNCEILVFRQHAIYDGGPFLKIPNGIYGFVSVEKANIQRIVAGEGIGRSDLSVSRIVPGNFQMHLVEPIVVAGFHVKTISLCVQEGGLFAEDLHYVGIAPDTRKVILVAGGTRGIGTN